MAETNQQRLCQLLGCPICCPHHREHDYVLGERWTTVTAPAEVVEEAAKDDCYLCGFLNAAGRTLLSCGRSANKHSGLGRIWNLLSREHQGLADLDDVPGLDIASYTVTCQGHPELFELGVSIKIEGQATTTIRYNVTVIRGTTALPIPTLDHTSMHEVSYLSPNNFGRIRQLISLCVDHHPNCAMKPPSKYPTQLLDLRDNQIRLSKAPEMGAQYTASSYYGGVAAVDEALGMLSTSVRRSGSIPMATLPRLFQDAIDLTRALLVPYLWINALCIIRDDRYHLDREVIKLHDVFNQAFLVISADCCSSTKEGFLQYGHLVEPVYAPQRNGTTIQLSDAGQHGLDSHTTPQAWCLQERIVAQRLLSFTTLEPVYECKEGQSCCCERYVAASNEEGPSSAIASFEKDNGSLTPPREGSWISDSTEFASMGADHGGSFPRLPGSLVGTVQAQKRRAQHDCWYRLIEIFTAKPSSKWADKLPAISAIAKHLHGSMSEDRYILGLWKNDMIFGLMWSGDGRMIEPENGPRDLRTAAHFDGRPRRQDLHGRATATWSWAAHESQVHWPERDQLAFTASLPADQWTVLSNYMYMHSPNTRLQIIGPLLKVSVHFHEDGFDLHWKDDLRAEHELLPLEADDDRRFTHATLDGRPVVEKLLKPGAGRGTSLERDSKSRRVRTKVGLKGDCYILWLTDTWALVLQACQAWGSYEYRRLGIIRTSMPAGIGTTEVCLI